MNERISDREYKIERVWILEWIIGPSIGALAFIIPFYLRAPSGPGEMRWIGLPLVAIVFVPYLVRLILVRNSFHYELGDKFITVRQGVISRQERHIPYTGIQNVIINRRLMDRVWGIAALTIENATTSDASAESEDVYAERDNGRTELLGASGNKLNIPGLKLANAEFLKKVILEKIKETHSNKGL